MLQDSTVMAMVAVKDIEAAKEFYGETLGLGAGEINPAGVLYKSGTGQIFVYQAPTAGTNQGTSATWSVNDVHAVVDALKEKGVTFEHYEFPGAEHEGDVHLMFGTKAAWFKDPDGNTLGLEEH
jgi:catechol 2,3-dioxygenase-like lactoylglutathione lyase family enzyme